GLATYDNISDHAVASGIEVELRKSLFTLSKKHRFNLGLNGSYIYTNVNLDPTFFVQNTTSTLEGAAPYILNADLTYNVLTAKNTEITSALVVNYVSDKVHTIGTRGFNNLVEEGLTTVDLVTSVAVNEKLKFALKAKNLLNPEYKLSRKGANSDKAAEQVIIRAYKRGVLLDLSVSYKF